MELTYQEEAQQLARSSDKALFKTIAVDWAKAEESIGKAAECELFSLNILRKVGIAIQEISGREQVTFEWFHRCQPELPKTMQFNAAKFCTHLARMFDSSIKTLDEARSARQMMFEAFGETTAPRRLEAQNSHDRNLWSEFVSATMGLTSLFKKLEVDKMSDWGRGELEKFVQSTDPIVKRNQEARVRLEEMR